MVKESALEVLLPRDCTRGAKFLATIMAINLTCTLSVKCLQTENRPVHVYTVLPWQVALGHKLWAHPGLPLTQSKKKPVFWYKHFEKPVFNPFLLAHFLFINHSDIKIIAIIDFWILHH